MTVYDKSDGGLLLLAVFALLCWAGVGVFAGWAATQKGRDGCGWSLLGLFLGPLAFLALIAVPAVRRADAGDASIPIASGPAAALPGTRVCPQCAEEVKAAARICRFCRYEFPEAALNAPPAPAPPTHPMADHSSATLGIWRVTLSFVPGLVVGDEAALSVDGDMLAVAKAGIGRMGSYARGSVRLAQQLQGAVQIFSGRDLVLSLAPIAGHTDRLLIEFAAR